MKMVVLGLVLFALSSIANAGRYEFTDKVSEYIVSSEGYGGSDYLGYLNIQNFENAGTICRKGDADLVTIPVRNSDQGKIQASIILAAAMADKKVFVRLEDDDRDIYDNCYLKQIRVSPNY